jgi:phage tail sheath protein FI
MPEYLSPGVYVEEVSYRSNIIEGVSTTTTGFVGPTRYGPITLEPELLTSLADFEAIYGDGTPLTFGSDTIPNFMWQAVRSFFTEGGQRLYVARTFNATSFDPTAQSGIASFAPSGGAGGATGSGSSSSAFASSSSSGSAAALGAIAIQARYPGIAGNFGVRFVLALGQSVLGGTTAAPTVSALRTSDVVLVTRSSGASFWLWSTTAQPGVFSNGAQTLQLSSLSPAAGDKVQLVTATVIVSPPSGSTPLTYTGLALDPGHMTNGSIDSLTGTFVAPDPTNPELARDLPIVVALTSGADGLAVLAALNALGSAGGVVSPTGVAGAGSLEGILTASNPALGATTPVSSSAWVDVTLSNGSDGAHPLPTDYAGVEDPVTSAKTGLTRFEDLDDVSIVAAPGSTFGLDVSDAVTVMGSLIAHAEKMRYRIAVLDSINAQGVTAVRALRAQVDSSYAALYYPWIRIYDPVSQGPLNIPPSGAVCGIYARNDTNRAVYKAPANEVVNLAIGFELLINKGQQDVLNPEGINCFRFFPDRGYRLWGARTVSSDPEWVYVNIRRYFAYLEHSLDKGTQWAVFEPNGPKLWDNVRRSVSEFLLNEWQSGALQGDKAEQAFFVRCDRTTMTQQDLDSGRLICLIGVAPLYPAEFVIFRIGQWTGSAST